MYVIIKSQVILPIQHFYPYLRRLFRLPCPQLHDMVGPGVALGDETVVLLVYSLQLQGEGRARLHTVKLADGVTLVTLGAL